MHSLLSYLLAGIAFVSTPVSTQPIPSAQGWQAICATARNTAPPPADAPDTATAKTLKSCSSEALYYGIGAEPDPARARQCAYTEIGHSSGAFSGEAMLATIYANGVGSKRNFDAAISFACELDSAGPEMSARIDHLEKLKKANWKGSSFSYCDDAASTSSWKACTAHQSKIEAVD